MAFSGALVHKAANQTGANFTTATAITWDSESYDVGGWHDTGSNTSRMTVPSGVTHVRLSARVTIDVLAGGATVFAWIAKNGDTNAATRRINMPSAMRYMASGAAHMTLHSGPLEVTAGDYFELYVLIAGDTSVTFYGGTDDPCWLSIEAIENFSGAMVKKAADQTTADYSAGAVVTWDTDVVDVGGWHDTGSNTSRLTVPSGVSFVRLTASVNFSSVASAADCYVYVIKDGDNVAATRHVNLPIVLMDGIGLTDYYTNLISGPIAVAAGTYFEVMVSIPADSSVTLEDHSWCAIEKLT